MPTTLRIVHGAGAPHEVSADVAAQFSGNSADALRRIAQEHLHDNELLATLNLDKEDVALEQFGDSPESTQETPLSLNSDWADVVQSLQTTNVELGVSRTHKGGRRISA